MSQRYIKGISKVYQRYIKGISKVYRRYIEGISKVYQILVCGTQDSHEQLPKLHLTQKTTIISEIFTKIGVVL
jgi:hypothetical protein